MSVLQEAVDCWNLLQVAVVNSSVEDREKKAVVNLPLDGLHALLLLAGKRQTIDPDTPGTIILFQGVDLQLESVNLLLLILQGHLQDVVLSV